MAKGDDGEMKIAICKVDKTRFPNLALLKLSAWHKKQGHTVSQYVPLMAGLYDKVYASKVFTWTQGNEYLTGNVDRGGTGYKMNNVLSDEIEHICPDYTGLDFSLGFLTRGCPNKCSWCIVPKKEGNIRPHADIEEFARHKKVVLMDNNVLAHNHGIEQIEKMARLGLRVDFNQGLDARLIDDGVAKRLSKLRWIRHIRMACDRKDQMPYIGKAVKLLSKYDVKPYRIFVYCLVKNIPDALVRVEFLRGLGVDPFAQPYRDFENHEPDMELRHFARWVNHKAIFKTVQWEDYEAIGTPGPGATVRVGTTTGR